MRRYMIALTMAFAMTLGFVNVDLSQLFDRPLETVSIGPDSAEARPGGSRPSFSRPSYRAPSRPSPSRPSPRPATKPHTKPAPKPATKPASKPAAKPSAAANAAKREQSRVKAAAAPKPTLRTSSGKTVKVAGTPAASSVRSMSSDRFSTRSARSNSYYRDRIPAGERTVIINRYGGGYYGDPYSGLFMYSLLSMSLHNQAMFHHHHWNSYSATRQQQLLAENAALKAEMASLSSVPRNPSYSPEGVDSDLMYSDEFVNAAYNPTPVPVEKESNFLVIFAGVLFTGFVGWAVWFVLFRRTYA